KDGRLSGRVGLLGLVFGALREAHLSLDEHGLCAREHGRVLLDLARTNLDRDAAREVLEIEECSLAPSILEEALAIALDHPGELHDGPILHAGALRDGRRAEPRETALALAARRRRAVGTPPVAPGDSVRFVRPCGRSL